MMQYVNTLLRDEPKKLKKKFFFSFCSLFGTVVKYRLGFNIYKLVRVSRGRLFSNRTLKNYVIHVVVHKSCSMSVYDDKAIFILSTHPGE